MDQPNPLTLPSGRQINPKSLNWKGYKAVRTSLINALSGTAVQKVLALLADPDVRAAWESGADGKLDALGSVAMTRATDLELIVFDAAMRIEEVSEAVLQHVTPADVILDEADPLDVLALLEHAVQNLNLAKLLDAEKNWLKSVGSSLFQVPTLPTNVAPAQPGT